VQFVFPTHVGVNRTPKDLLDITHSYSPRTWG